MITCDFFEEKQIAWKAGELDRESSDLMENHVSICIHCKAFKSEVAELRKITTSLPDFQVPDGFEFRLQRKIDRLKAGKQISRSKSTNYFPKWAALGAGLATGAAIAITLLLPNDNLKKSNSQFASQPTGNNNSNSHFVSNEVDTLSDSTNAGTSGFHLDKFSQTVGSDK